MYSQYKSLSLQKKTTLIVSVIVAISVLSTQVLTGPSLSVTEQGLVRRLAVQQAWLERTLDAPSYVVELNNSHFRNGTVIIDDQYILLTNASGALERQELPEGDVVVRITEDISFNPNNIAQGLPAHRAGYVAPEQYQYYDPRAYAIGFFAAIAVQREGVVIDLNGMTLEQSHEHSLQQRFFALIELADQPFLPMQGPANFGEELDAAERVAIINGQLGRSSHHGIHGQLPQDILIQNVNFSQFEVAAISLHGAVEVSINDVEVRQNRQNIETVGLYSALRFIQPYLQRIPDDFEIAGVTNRALTLRLQEINDAVVRDAPEWRTAYPFIVNQSGLIDGNAYGIVINQKGVAINGFPENGFDDDSSDGVYLKRVVIDDIAMEINEMPALRDGGSLVTGPQHDVVGSVLQTEGLVLENGYFSGTLSTAPIQLAQAMVAKALYSGVDFQGLPTNRNTISQATVSFIDGEQTFEAAGLRYVLNGDSMHHVNKGIVALKLDGTNNAALDNVVIKNVRNVSPAALRFEDIPFYPTLSELERSYDQGKEKSVKGATILGAGINDARGVSVAASSDVALRSVTIDGLSSTHGPSFGIDVMNGSSAIEIIGESIVDIAENTNARLPGSLDTSQHIRWSESYQ